MNWETWGPPLVVLGVGLAAGFFVTLRSRPDSLAPGDVEDRRRALLARKESLLDQVRALELDRDKMDEAEWRAQRDSLVDAAAQVLRELDELDARAAGEAAGDGAAAPEAPARPGGRRALWAALSVGFFVVLGLVLVQFTAPRQQAGTGGGMGGAAAALPPAVQAAMERVQRDPGDVQALNTLTYHALLVRDLDGALRWLEQARRLAPEDPDVLVHLAMLQGSVGMFDRALESVDRAIELAPDRGKPLLWKGYVIVQMGNGPKAAEALEAALEKGLDPTEREIAASLLAEASKLPDVPLDQLAGSSAPPAGTNPHAPGAASPEAAGARVSGTVELPPGARVPEGAVLYVMARRAAAGGPPVAVRRVPASSFPASFSLGDGDLMMGGEWPAEVWLAARLDADGSVDTRSPDDLASEPVGPVAPGATGVRLVLAGGG